MLNFSNLASYEFELLVKDVLEKELGISLRTYAPGPDSGIDIRGYASNDVIIQVKHYINSTFSTLRNALKNELKNVKRINPKRYIIVTSLNLSPDNETEIFKMFDGYIETKKDIIDINFLNSFLEKECNIDILRVHNKLWLASTNAIDLIFNKTLDVDSKYFINDYNEKVNLFVTTNSYINILNNLNEHNIIIIEGGPGVGKTTLSKMLIAFYSNEGYKFKYASNNSISEIKKGITTIDKEVILMDNFLGQRLTDLSSHFFEELKVIISLSRASENKKLIINSRSIVLNESLSRNQSFADLLEVYNVFRYEVKSEELSILERAKILYNHIYFNKLSKCYYCAIVENKNYLRIIQHENFNPRIIEYITRKKKIEKLPCDKLFSYMMIMLDNPKEIWKEEFDNLTKFERIFMFILFSLISCRSYIEYVDIHIVKKCFELRVNKEPNYDTTLDIFEQIINKLKGGLIKLEISEEFTMVGIINPSVEDFIYNYLCKQSEEVVEILNASIYVEQWISLKKLEIDSKIYEEIQKNIFNRHFLRLDSFSNLNVEHYFLRFIFDFRCKYSELVVDIHNIFRAKKAFTSDREQNAILIMDFFTKKEMYEYYKMYNLLNDETLVYKIYEYLYFDQVCIFINIHEMYMRFNKLYQLSNELLNDMCWFIGWEIELDIIHNNSKIIYEGINEVNKKYCLENHLFEENFEILYDETKKEFVDYYLKPIIDEKMNCIESNIVMKSDIKVNINKILEEINFYEKIALNCFDDEHSYNILDNDIYQENDYETITHLFSSEYIVN